MTLRDRELADAVRELRATLAAAGLRDAGDVTASSCSAPGPAVVAATGADAVLVWADTPLPEPTIEALLAAGRRPVVLAGPTLDAADTAGLLAAASGVRGTGRTPCHDIRVRAGADGAPLAPRVLDHGHDGGAHVGEHTHVGDRVLLVDKTGDGVEHLLAARVGLTEHPVATWRPATGVLAWTLGTTPSAVSSRSAVRLLLLALRHVLGTPPPSPVRVGLLGYGAIGHEHSRAVRAVPGLELAAVCDVSPERVAAALARAPGIRGHATPEALLADDGVDLVVVSTPPASHAPWSLATLEAAKHVVVEKPFAITTQEADGVLALAADRGLVAVCYQNRRFDADHVAVRRRGGRRPARRDLPRRGVRRRVRSPVQPLALRRRGLRRRVLRLGRARPRPAARPRAGRRRARDRGRAQAACGST